MVRPSSACLKIIACGGAGADSAAQDELDLLENKGSTDKRGWSFRKKSARHRVLSNNVSSELSSGGNKESPETAATGFPAETSPRVSEKIPMSQKTDEVSQISPDTDNTEPLPSIDKPGNIEVFSNIIDNIHDSVAIVIQTAIRGYMAQKTLCKLKNVVKLQATFRGHLVRRHAAGSLRCVQAIVKMQALVRARHARKSAKGSAVEENSFGKLIADDEGKDNLWAEINQSYSSSTKKLLSNGFARQLLETKSNTKQINIKCDPAKPNSAWQWLVRWMATSTSDISPSEIAPTNEVEVKTTERGTEAQIAVVSEHKTVNEESVESSMKYRTSDVDDFDFHVGNLNTVVGNRADSAVEINNGASETKDENTVTNQEKFMRTSIASVETPDSISDWSSMPSQPSLGFATEKPELDRETSRRTVKRAASEILETDVKKFGYGLRKAPNPAFAAVQSKFEELSSSVSTGRLINACDDVSVDTGLEFPPSHVDSATSVTKTKEFSSMEDSHANDPRSQNVGSECGTELSITSTLDSPDRFEHESGMPLFESRAAEKVDPDPVCATDDTFDLAYIEDKSNNASAVIIKKNNASAVPDVLSVSDKANMLTETADVNENSADSHVLMEPKREELQPVETSSLYLDVQIGKGTDQIVEKLSAEGSPRSRIDILDSLQGTPSSQISVSSRRSKSDNSKPKRQPQSHKKRSPANPGQDSGGRNSTEQLPKDSKSGKRRNSFDHESRVSISNSSLPNYMQATESAKAKLQNHNSPKTSPDVNEKDVNVKKRHSLPASNGKQGSPRMQRSMSQVQQNAKGNETHSPQTERRWVR